LANFFRILGGSFGTSLSVTLWEHREIIHNSQLVESLSPLQPGVEQALQQLHNTGFTEAKALAQIAKVITNQAYMLASNDIFLLSGCVFLSLLVVVWLARPPFTEPNDQLITD